jgi:menaquinone-dependent protoporphyrinogen oxidase
MPRILVLFASSHGQTREIARSLANHLRRHGHAVDLVDSEVSAPPSPETYEAVVIGSRVLFGRYARSIRRYVARHVQVLCEMPSAFFSVSMSVVGGKPDPYLPAFLEETGWKPELTISLAGGLPYRSYNPLLRLVMKRISRKFGHTTDTSRDHDFTALEHRCRGAWHLERSLTSTPARRGRSAGGSRCGRRRPRRARSRPFRRAARRSSEPAAGRGRSRRSWW